MAPLREPSDEDLILYFYGESADAAAIAEQLAASPALQERYAELQRLLAVADQWSAPELPPDYGAELWQRLQPRLSRSPVLAAAHRFGARTRRWLPAAAAAALLLCLGYLAGRVAPREAPADLRALSVEARQRILVETLAEHLEASQRLFTELANVSPDKAGALAGERQAARDLLSANRLYRTAAQRGGREGVAALLGEMEPVLLELAHLPAEPDAGEVEFLRRRIDSQGLLFKTRVASDLLTRSLRLTTSPSRPTV